MKNILGKNKVELRKLWIIQEILKIIEKRNSQRKKDFRNYKIIKNRVTEKYREAKEFSMKGMRWDLKGYS